MYYLIASNFCMYELFSLHFALLAKLTSFFCFLVWTLKIKVFKNDAYYSCDIYCKHIYMVTALLSLLTLIMSLKINVTLHITFLQRWQNIYSQLLSYHKKLMTVLHFRPYEMIILDSCGVDVTLHFLPCTDV